MEACVDRPHKNKKRGAEAPLFHATRATHYGELGRFILPLAKMTALLFFAEAFKAVEYTSILPVLSVMLPSTKVMLDDGE